MSLFDWLWGAEEKPRRRTPVDVPGFLDIPERGFFGEYGRSPDGRYTIAWRDATEDGGHGGARSRGLGLYLLLLDGEVVLEGGSLQRPNDGKVADSGVFVFNDWLFSNGLDGSFHAFAPEGRVIL